MYSFDIRVARKKKEKKTHTRQTVSKTKNNCRVNNVLGKSIFSHFASNTRLFESTERSLCVQVVDTVDLLKAEGNFLKNN